MAGINSMIKQYWKPVLNVLLLLSPLALIFPWTVTAGHLGVGYGGYAYFLQWLTKYPDFGPINLEVLLGMICLIGTAFVPVVFSIFVWLRQESKWRNILLFLLMVMFWLPVFIKLDDAMLLLGFWGKGLYILGTGGPLMRFFALITMGLLSLTPKNR